MAVLLKPGAYVPENPRGGYWTLFSIGIITWAALIGLAIAGIWTVDVLSVAFGKS